MKNVAAVRACNHDAALGALGWVRCLDTAPGLLSYRHAQCRGRLLVEVSEGDISGAWASPDWWAGKPVPGESERVDVRDAFGPDLLDSLTLAADRPWGNAPAEVWKERAAALGPLSVCRRELNAVLTLGANPSRVSALLAAFYAAYPDRLHELIAARDSWTWLVPMPVE